MKEWQIYPIRDLSGGMQMMVSPFLINKDEFKFIKNYSLEVLGQLRKITGYSQKGTAIDGATSVAGGTPFYTTSLQKEVVAIDNSTSIDFYIYAPSTDTWTAQSQSLTTGSRVEFAQFLGGLFSTNYEDSPLYYDGSSWSDSTNLTSAPQAKYVMPYYDRLYLINIQYSGNDHPSRVAMSSLPDDSYNITWDLSDTGNYFDISPKDGDQLMGVGKNFNRLLLFKEESLWRYDTNSLYQFPGAPGTNSHRSIVNVLDWTLYFHKSGVYGVNGESVVKLSRSIQPIIDGVKSINLSNICAYGKGDYYYLYLSDVENYEEDIKIDNCLVVLDVANMRWSIEDLGHSPLAFWNYRDDRSNMTYDDSSYEYDYPLKTYNGLVSAEDFIHFGDDAGNIYEFSSDQLQFDSTDIISYFETHNYYFSGLEGFGKLQAVNLYIENAKRIKLYYSIDDGPWKAIKKYEYKNDRIYLQFDNEIVANRIKFKGIDSSKGTRGIVRGFDIFYTSYNQIV